LDVEKDKRFKFLTNNFTLPAHVIAQIYKSRWAVELFKQVEFIRAANVSTSQIYVYDGLKLDPTRYNGWNWENIRNDSSYGTESNPKIWVMREFNNSQANHLGMPLPQGRVRFYRRNHDRQIEFTGENVIDHDERVRVYTGNAFDLTGERRRTDYRLDTNR
jgi:hypothetical protein